MNEELERIERELDLWLDMMLIDEAHDVALVITAMSQAMADMAGGLEVYEN